MWWESQTVMVEQCGGTVEQSWWNSETLPWNSGTMMVEKCGTVMVGQWNSKVVQCGGTV